MTTDLISDDELTKIRQRCEQATAGPWRERLESREGFSGSDFIQTGDQQFEIDGATEADYVFIAHARQDIPRLLAELERLRGALPPRD